MKNELETVECTDEQLEIAKKFGVKHVIHHDGVFVTVHHYNGDFYMSEVKDTNKKRGNNE